MDLIDSAHQMLEDGAGPEGSSFCVLLKFSQNTDNSDNSNDML